MKTVLITGAGKRVGAHLATGLAAAGWAVAVHYNHSAEAAEKIADEICAAGGKAVTVQGNLVDAKDRNTLVERTIKALGSPLTALINNASKFTHDSAKDFTADGFHAHMDINLLAPILLGQHFAAQCPKGAHGCIINIIDQRVLKPSPPFFTYGLSKSALHWATHTMAQALAPNIRVNAIGPGPTLQNSGQTQDEFAREAATTLLEHGSSPADLLDGCLYLLTAKSVTGQMIAIDGGQHLTWKTDDLLIGYEDDQ